MRKLTQRLLIATALFITVISLSLPAEPARAGDSYCDTMGPDVSLHVAGNL